MRKGSSVKPERAEGNSIMKTKLMIYIAFDPAVSSQVGDVCRGYTLTQTHRARYKDSD